MGEVIISQDTGDLLEFNDEEDGELDFPGEKKIDSDSKDSDIDGLYTADPHRDENAVLINQVSKVDDKILALAGVSSTTQGTGGMVTKLHAAEICLSCGCDMVIANGSRPENLYDILDGKAVGTMFSEKCV